MTQLNDKKVHFYANSKTTGGYVVEEVSAMARELQERRSADVNPVLATVERDALRYRFLRDKEEFGAENEPGLASWDDLGDLGYDDFDAAVDARIAHPDIDYVSLDRVFRNHERDAAPQPVAVPDVPPDHLLPKGDSNDARDRRGATINGWKLCRAAALNQTHVKQPSSGALQLPDGWKLVPVELTCEMDDAAWDAYHDNRCMSDIYAAMLAAAPQEPTK